MSRKLVIEGNAIYEIDEECMLKKKLKEQKEQSSIEKRNDSAQENKME